MGKRYNNIKWSSQKWFHMGGELNVDLLKEVLEKLAFLYKAMTNICKNI